MIDETTLRNFLKDLIDSIVERSAAAQRESKETSDDFNRGRLLAFREVLATIQGEATSFEIPLAELGLDGLNPLSDDLEYPRRQDRPPAGRGTVRNPETGNDE